MKQQKVKKWITAVLTAVVLSLCAVSAVSAEEFSYEPEVPQTEYVAPQTEYIPETEEVYTEPVYTEEPVYTDPVETEPETEYVAPVTEYIAPETEYVNNLVTPTEYFEPPTLPKTISQKTYSTNYSAGIISWICVGVGVIVIIVVLVSTKISGRRRGI